MLREIEEALIKDEKLLTAQDYAPLDCDDCAGCSECCRESAVMIILDAADVQMLKSGLNYSFEAMVNLGMIQLRVIDGTVLPGLGTDDNGVCVFLDEKGRCKIHDHRPGICRMFPLARIYHEDGSFHYFMQTGECGRQNGKMVQVADWIGIENMEEYESKVRAYHDDLVELRVRSSLAKDLEEKSKMQLEFLQRHFVN